MKVERIVSLCAMNKNKNAFLEGPGGHLLPFTKDWGEGLMLLSTDLWEKIPSSHHEQALILQGADNRRNAVLQ